MLRRRADPEVERRLALSLAISGQRDAALRVIDGQLRRHDRAAWRTQAFVLALTGDARRRRRIRRARMMPAANAQEMAPFFARLAGAEPGAKGGGGPFRPLPERRPRHPGRIQRRHPRRSRRARSGPQRADPGAPAAAPSRSTRRRAAAPAPSEDRSPPIRDRGEEAPPVEPRRLRAARRPSRSGRGQARAKIGARAAPAPVEPPREAPAFAPGAAFTLEPGGDQPRAAPAEAPPAPPAAPTSATSPRWSSRCPTRRRVRRRRRRATAAPARRACRAAGARSRSGRSRAAGQSRAPLGAARPRRRAIRAAARIRRGAGRGAGPARQPRRLCRRSPTASTGCWSARSTASAPPGPSSPSSNGAMSRQLPGQARRARR